MRVTGTIINYYFHCRRQCWLFANRVNLEDNSEEVRIGKVLHELKFQDQKKSEILIDQIKVDKLTNEYLIELKKSDADVEAVKWQVLYYLKVLKDKGIEREGKIIFHEKKKQSETVIYVNLDEETEKKLDQTLYEIEEYISSGVPAEPLLDNKCKKCAYYEYCFI